MGTSYNPKIVTNGLVLNLDAANKKSYPGAGTTWTDLTKNKSNGTTVNSPVFSSNNNGYFTFDGVSTYVNMPTSSFPTGNQITIGIWNYGITAVAASAIWLGDVSNNRTINIHLPWSDNTVYFDCGNSGGTYDRINTAALSASQWQNSWHYWVFTKNVTTGTMQIFLDGVLNTSGTGKTLPILIPTTAYIGRFTGTYHNGRISKVDVYNRVLTASEILQNYNATKGRFG